MPSRSAAISSSAPTFGLGQRHRDTGFLLPPSVDEWLPEKHLARFVVEVIDGLDLRVLIASYRGSGSASYHPALLLGILVYGYATGVFSSRKLERASNVS
jgi:transposase